MAWIRNRPVGLVYRDASLSEDGSTLFCSVRGHHATLLDPEAHVVLEIDPAGRTVREWRSWEHLSFEQDEICPLESRKEWTHANVLDLTPRRIFGCSAAGRQDILAGAGTMEGAP